jgi:hypothetical protein
MRTNSLIFTGASVIVWWLAFAHGTTGTAAAGQPGANVEAERMHVAHATGRVVRDASASGRRALLLTGRGWAHIRVSVGASSRLNVVARRSRCGGAPRLQASVDGTRVLSATVGGARWRARAARGTIAPGRHTLRVRLADPHRARSCRRTVRVDRLVLVPAAARWVPAPTTTWQWQLTTPVDLTVDAQMFDIDLFDNPADVVAQLHAQGRRAVCYLSAGTVEQGRPDTGDFPSEVQGKALPDYPDERWLDVRRLDVLGPIMESRLDLCAAKGFDGVEADNVDAYANDSGFPLTAADQLAYNRFLAHAAHARGLSIGLKNDLDQVAELEPDFDWALDEQCFQYDECDKEQPFVRAGKAVFEVEYERDTATFCPAARAAGLMAMRKRLDLDAWRETCW